MKTILISLMNLELGGIGKACIDLVNSLADDFEIYVLPFSNNGDYSFDSRKNISIIDTPKRLKILGMSQSQTKKLGFVWYVYRFALSAFTKIFGSKIPYFLCFNKYKIDKEFDIAISYTQDGPSTMLYGGVPEFVLNHIKAKRKYAFIHDDFRRKGYRSKKNIRLYNSFNTVITLSNELKNEISSHLSTRVISIPNIIDVNKIICCSKEDVDISFKENKINLLTVARLSEEKGLLRCISAISKSNNKELDWYIIGDGKLKKKIVKKIKRMKLDKSIHLLGKKKNPYPYYLMSDYYLMCSLNEALPVVVDEAHSLSVQVISTNYISANSQLLDTDIICDNNEESLSSVLARTKKSNFHKDTSKQIIERNNKTIELYKKEFN